MVALAPNTSETSTWDVLDGFPKLHSRAREAKTLTCAGVASSKSLDRIEIWQAIYDDRIGLESFTRDPIGFEGSEWNMYECFGSSALIAIDPDGQKVRVPCTSLLITTANTWCRDYGGIKTGPVCYRGTTPAGKTYDILMVTCNDHTCDYGDYVYLRAKIKGYCDYPHSCVDFTCPCSASEKGTICNDIWGRIRIGKNCSKYRMKLNVDCFGGAEDETHRLEREAADRAVKRCKEKATECDCRYWTTP